MKLFSKLNLTKFIITAGLFTAISASVVGCRYVNSPGNVTIEGLVKANTNAVLLAQYDNILLTKSIDDGSNINFYYTKDVTFYQEGDNVVLYDREKVWRHPEIDGTKALAFNWYAMEESEMAQYMLEPSEMFSVLDEEYTLKETIDKVTDNKDGTLTIETSVSAEALTEIYGADNPDIPADMKYKYTVNKNNLELKNCSYSIQYADGKTESVSYDVIFNAEEPDEMKDMLAQIDEFNNSNPAEGEKKTITVIYDYGTDSEQTFSITVDRKYMVAPFLREGYTAYADPDKTEYFAGGDGVHDLVIYAFPEEENK